MCKATVIVAPEVLVAFDPPPPPPPPEHPAARIVVAATAATTTALARRGVDLMVVKSFLRAADAAATWST